MTNIEPIDLFNTDEGEWNWRSYLRDNEIDYELSRVLDKLVVGAVNRRFQSVAEVTQALSGETNITRFASHPPVQRRKSSPKSRSRRTKKAIGKLQFRLLDFHYTKISPDPCVILGQKVSLSTSRYPGKAKYTTFYLENDITLDLIGIPGGKFLMGSPESELEREIEESSQHPVTINSFLIGRYPITQAQWWAVMNNNPARFADSDVAQSKRPVERVSWLDCTLFCEELSRLTGRIFRLPSEAEWEYACRAKSQTPFHCGSTISTELANYNGEDIYDNGVEGENRQETTDVDRFSPNPFGLCDLHGNVAEWCLDNWHSSYQHAPADGTAWIGSNPKAMRVLRGGSWLHLPGSCRSAQRLKSAPHNKSDAFGFRVAMSI